MKRLMLRTSAATTVTVLTAAGLMFVGDLIAQRWHGTPAPSPRADVAKTRHLYLAGGWVS